MNENSDTWVVKQLGEELMPEFRRLRREEQLGWTQIMNRQMRSLWEKGVSGKRPRRLYLTKLEPCQHACVYCAERLKMRRSMLTTSSQGVPATCVPCARRFPPRLRSFDLALLLFVGSGERQRDQVEHVPLAGVPEDARCSLPRGEGGSTAGGGVRRQHGQYPRAVGRGIRWCLRLQFRDEDRAT